MTKWNPEDAGRAQADAERGGGYVPGKPRGMQSQRPRNWVMGKTQAVAGTSRMGRRRHNDLTLGRKLDKALGKIEKPEVDE